MGDLITLNCPSCGGKLEVNSNTLVLTCQHCGSEHMVHRDSGVVTLESFARCPKCGRNDRVEKVSAIYNYKSGSEVLISKLAPPRQSDYMNSPIKPIPDLKLPEKPKIIEIEDMPKQNKFAIILLGLLIFILFGSLYAIFFVPTHWVGVAIFAIIIISFAIALIFNVTNKINQIRNNYEGYVQEVKKKMPLLCSTGKKNVKKRKNFMKKKNY